MVINSRPQKRHNNIWRRRQCSACKAVFTTFETPDLFRGLSVRRLRKIEPFSRDKLYLSIHSTLGHRKTATEDASALTATALGKLWRLVSDGSVEDREIALVVSEILTAFDKAAAISYKAYHPVIIR